MCYSSNYSKQVFNMAYLGKMEPQEYILNYIGSCWRKTLMSQKYHNDVIPSRFKTKAQINHASIVFQKEDAYTWDRIIW